jgi:hypothetical protein
MDLEAGESDLPEKDLLNTVQLEGNFQGAKFSWFLVKVGVNNINLMLYFF